MDSLYPTISPVNSFRVVLNQYFGTDLEYLPDLSYVEDLENGPYGRVDVCEEYNYCSEE